MSRAAWRRISPTPTSRVPSDWKATGWRSGMARLGGVCWNVCADLADSLGVARRHAGITMVGDKSPDQPRVKNSFPSAHSCNPSLPKSCGSCLRREQACRNLTEDLLVVSGYRPLHMNTSALYACFLHQPLELTLKKDFQLLRGQDGNGNSRGLAGIGLDPDAVWGFGLLRFWSHATPPFWSDESGTEES